MTMSSPSRIRRPKAVHAAGRQSLLANDPLQQSLGIVPQPPSFFAGHGIGQDRRVFALHLPGHEIGRPIDVFGDLRQRKIVEHAAAEERRHVDPHRRPIGLESPRHRVLIRNSCTDCR